MGLTDPSSGLPLTFHRLVLIVVSSMVGFFAGLTALRIMASVWPEN